MRGAWPPPRSYRMILDHEGTAGPRKVFPDHRVRAVTSEPRTCLETALIERREQTVWAAHNGTYACQTRGYMLPAGSRGHCNTERPRLGRWAVVVGFTSPVPLVTFRTPSNNPVSECQAARDQALRGMHNDSLMLSSCRRVDRTGVGHTVRWAGSY